MDSKEYLKMARETLPRKSDYALAKKLGVTQQAVSNYMTGKRIMDDTTALKVAELLKIEPIRIIAAANEERENGANREKWELFYKRLGGVAASIIFAVTLIVTPTPARAATRAALDGLLCILCKIIEALLNSGKQVLLFPVKQETPFCMGAAGIG